MRIRCIDRLADLLPYRTEWNRLARQSPTNTIFQTFEWLESWWETLADDARPCAVLGCQDQTVVAAGAFALATQRRYGRTFTRLEFAGGLPTDYQDLLYRDVHEAAQFVAALRDALPWDWLCLDRIPAASSTVSLFARAFPGWRGTHFICDACPAYVFSPEHNGSEILRKKSLRRHEHGLAKAGVVDVRHLSRAEAIEPYLDAFFAQHIERRAVTDTPSHFLDPRYRHFYRALTRRLAAREWLLFTVISLNAQLVAFHYGFVHEQRLIWYKPTFAVAQARLSPGEVLLASLFRVCRERGLRELDFTIGDEAFKHRFSTVTRHNLRFEAFRNPSFQYLGRAERFLWKKVKRLSSSFSLEGNGRK